MKSDEDFLEQFEKALLSDEEWTHRAHVKVAFLYLKKYPYEQSLNKVRQGIQALNQARNVSEGPTSGYNETTTQAFMRLVDTTIRAYESLVETSSADSFCDAHPQLLTRHVLRLFYSPAQRSHPEAKFRFIEPDLAPLPIVK